MSEIIEKSIYELVRNGYKSRMEFVNEGHSIPQIDGLVLGQRRLIYTLYKNHKSSLAKTILVLGETMSLHPHSTDSLEEPLNKLVRNGLVVGRGSFGSTTKYRDIRGANPRYTEVKYNSSIDEILFRFKDQLEMIPGEIEGFTEPKYMITPIPFCLIFGLRSIGTGGTVTNIPAFTYESLLNAYKNNDPTLLESTYGLNIDREKSDLDKIWNKGFGKLVLSFDVQKKGDDVFISGDASVFKPDLSILRKMEKNGRVNIQDLSSKNMLIKVSRVSGTKNNDINHIYKLCKDASTLDGLRSTCIIMMSHNKSVSRIGIKSWLKMCMDKYTIIYEKWKEDELKKIQRKIDLYNLIPLVSEKLRENKSTAKISEELKITKKKVLSVESLPLKLLRKSSFREDIDKLEKEKEKINNSDINLFIEKGIKLNKKDLK